MDKIKGIIFMSSWNTDGGVTRHATPVVNWLIENGYRIKVLTHYRETPHGFNLNVEDEEFVERCYTLEGKELKNLPPLNIKPIISALEEGYNVFVAEDLGMLPMRQLLEIFPKIKERAKTVLINHDNIPKPKNSIFWKFDWDAIVNFLPEQVEFMKSYYPEGKIYLVEFPAYPRIAVKESKDDLRMKLKFPRDKKIIILFGEYDFIDPFDVLREYRRKHKDTFLVALVYTEKDKEEINRILKTRFNESYDEIRVEISSWKKRAEYVMASDLVILDKGKTRSGKGAVLSSTAFQVIGWGTPILARSNEYFRIFNDNLETYKGEEEMFRKIEKFLNDDAKRSDALKKQEKFWSSHHPEKISLKLLQIFEKLLAYECASKQKCTQQGREKPWN